MTDAVNGQIPVVHPENPESNVCHHHVYLAAPGSTAQHFRHAMAIHPGWFDRSPCGTGTSARMAQPHARGELGVGAEFVNDSFSLCITGTAQYMLDPDDPFPAGF